MFITKNAPLLFVAGFHRRTVSNNFRVKRARSIITMFLHRIIRIVNGKSICIFRTRSKPYSENSILPYPIHRLGICRRHILPSQNNTIRICNVFNTFDNMNRLILHRLGGPPILINSNNKTIFRPRRNIKRLETASNKMRVPSIVPMLMFNRKLTSRGVNIMRFIREGCLRRVAPF